MEHQDSLGPDEPRPQHKIMPEMKAEQPFYFKLFVSYFYFKLRQLNRK